MGTTLSGVKGYPPSDRRSFQDWAAEAKNSLLSAEPVTFRRPSRQAWGGKKAGCHGHHRRADRQRHHPKTKLKLLFSIPVFNYFLDNSIQAIVYPLLFTEPFLEKDCGLLFMDQQ